MRVVGLLLVTSMLIAGSVGIPEDSAIPQGQVLWKSGGDTPLVSATPYIIQETRRGGFEVEPNPSLARDVPSSLTFDVPDLFGGAGTFPRQGDLIADGENIAVFQESGLNLEVGDVGPRLDALYNITVQFFGTPNDNDGTPEIFVFVVNFGGGFAAGAYMPSNNLDVLFIDVLAYVDIDNVFVHELNHMIHHRFDPNEELWIMEGMATWTENYVFGRLDFVPLYAANPDVDFTFDELDPFDAAAQYGGAQLFFKFIEDHYGQAAVLEIFHSTSRGMQSVVDVVEPTTNPDEMVIRFGVSNLIHDLPNPPADYDYSALEVEFEEVIHTGADTRSEDVQEHGFDYYLLSGFSGPATVVIEGNDLEVSVIDPTSTVATIVSQFSVNGEGAYGFLNASSSSNVYVAVTSVDGAQDYDIFVHNDLIVTHFTEGDRAKVRSPYHPPPGELALAGRIVVEAAAELVLDGVVVNFTAPQRGGVEVLGYLNATDSEFISLNHHFPMEFPRSGSGWFTNVTIIGVDEQGVVIRSDEVFFERVTITNSESGIHLIESKADVINSFIFSSNQGPGILIEGGKPRVHGNTISGNAGDGITVLDTSGFVIDENEVFRNGGYGIRVHGWPGPTLRNNNVYNNTLGDVKVDREPGRGDLIPAPTSWVPFLVVVVFILFSLGYLTTTDQLKKNREVKVEVKEKRRSFWNEGGKMVSGDTADSYRYEAVGESEGE